MRILIWPSGYPPRIGGVEALSAELAASLQERGHEISVLVPDAPAGEATSVERSVRVFRLPLLQALEARDPAGILAARRRVADILQTVGPDVIHLNAFHPGLVFYLDAPGAREVPTLFSIHAFPPIRLDEDSIPGRALRAAGWVTACAELLLDRARQAAPEITPRSSALPNAVPASGAPAPPASGPPSAVCVGRLVPSKGFDLALEAFSRVVRDFPGARLRLVGDGPARRDLERQRHALGLQDCVEFVGAVPPEEVSTWIDQAHAVVIPSRGDEGLPLVALEAAQRERPVVASRVDGIPEALVHNETGLLVEPDAVEELAAALRTLFDDPRLAARLGRAARERALREFSWDAAVDRYEYLYQRLAHRSRP